MSEIKYYIMDMLPYMAAAVPISILLRVIAYFVNKKKNIKTTPQHEIGFLLFAIFIAGLISQTVVPKLPWGEIGLDFSKIKENIFIRLIPGNIFFDSAAHFSIGDYSYFIVNFVGNIVMFFPIGFFVPLLWRSSFKKTVLIGALCSLTIEILQLPQPRCSDLDDLWLNTLGAAIGYLIYFPFGKYCSISVSRFKTIGRSHSSDNMQIKLSIDE